MKYCRLLMYDLRSGFRANYKKILTFALVIVFFCAEFYGKKRIAYINEPVIPQGTVMDCIYYLHAGIREYIPDFRDAFRLPVRWLLLHLLVLYGTLYYPFRDLQVLGGNLLQRGGKRSTWWISKCTWVILYTIGSYLLLCGIALIVAFLMGERLEWGITKEFTLTVSGGVNYPEFMQEDFLWILLFMPLMVMIAMNLLQLCLALFLRPVYSFLFCALLLLASSYKLSPFLIGNYAMMLRDKSMLDWGVEASQGVWLAGAIILFSVIAGLIRFSKWDILHQEQS